MADTKARGVQDFLERNIWGLLIMTAIVLSIGGIVEIVPLFYLKSTEESNRFPEIVWDQAGQTPIVSVDDSGKEVWNWKAGDGIRPYTALELAGRDIYQREGCYLCHSQQVRPFRDERERYGHYSLASESMFDHPFQWGSKRTGPDLARVGAKYSDAWQRQHLHDPRSVVPESIMPSYPWLEERLVNGKRQAFRMRGLRLIGVPYADADIETAPALTAEKTEMDALVAYLQVLGTMANLQPGVDYRE
ncbi:MULTISPECIES: cytochrome-c oxidase, cbb3-type subunit II [Thiorhodovibrio]|uniref:cytochrome-c oxidase, cbb3-type subunit II n=1 Tax=Thiorhodovibrio TaxID=61593 RepID=UPI001913DE30|nr:MULTISPECIES: cytochrome-c oxidase, cbb3-type subunit II [Thiorhodovibrio]MBK5967429.1 cytochrome-c oxidase, cbb3-type subunit II [Thiorhodovibrio winogradskyi]WPL12555.1 cbb3-type cytochrome c oxidase subunit II [Thiorhodovibrio litoralis]